MPRRCWDKLEVKTWMHSSMKSIEDMVAALLKENADEINKDFCVDEFNKKQLEMERTERQNAGHVAKIEDLEMQTDALTKAMVTPKAESQKEEADSHNA